jgi:HPt (histidine-containing phosphotransfer) domain-containing protein
MTQHIDLAQLQSLIGTSPQLLVRLAKAFTGQLPDWLADFERQTQAGNTEQMARLLHKMKGGCHAISATAVAQAFASAEQALALAAQQLAANPGDTLAWSGAHLLVLLREVQAELDALVAAAQTQTSTLAGGLTT